MAGRPIKSATVAQPVKGRAMPENEIPPAMRVDIYLQLFNFFLMSLIGQYILTLYSSDSVYVSLKVAVFYKFG